MYPTANHLEKKIVVAALSFVRHSSSSSSLCTSVVVSPHSSSLSSVVMCTWSNVSSLYCETGSGCGRAVRMNGGDNREEEVVVDRRKAQEAALFFLHKSFEPALNMSHDQC
jgi:hypothetical protein